MGLLVISNNAMDHDTTFCFSGRCVADATAAQEIPRWKRHQASHHTSITTEYYS
jgi:hypothetical protein